jgi:hypothetical protein
LTARGSARAPGPGDGRDRGGEATHNRGLTWRSLGTPTAPALPDDIAAYLSCPVAAGCIAIANDQIQVDMTRVVLSDLHNTG